MLLKGSESAQRCPNENRVQNSNLQVGALPWDETFLCYIPIANVSIVRNETCYPIMFIYKWVGGLKSWHYGDFWLQDKHKYLGKLFMNEMKGQIYLGTQLT